LDNLHFEHFDKYFNLHIMVYAFVEMFEMEIFPAVGN